MQKQENRHGKQAIERGRGGGGAARCAESWHLARGEEENEAASRAEPHLLLDAERGRGIVVGELLLVSRRERGTGNTSARGRHDLDLAGARLFAKDGAEIALTSMEFELLKIFVANPGRVLSREHLMDAVKGEALEAFDRSIDVHISRIRAAIEDDPKRPRRLLTVRGAGYVFAAQQD